MKRGLPPHQGWVKYAAAILLGIALIVQTRSLITRYIQPVIRSAWAIRDLPAWKRSAHLLGGSHFAGYIDFVRANSPEDARIILPPRQPVRNVAHVGLMQYFLFPRDIHNCGTNEVEECVLRVTGSNTYILGLSDFPPRELAERSKVFVPYDDELGIFAPISADTGDR